MLSDFQDKVKGIDVVIEMLTSSFWEGKRWVAFDGRRPSLEVSDLQCFTDYNTAVKCCMEKSDKNKPYKVVVLGRILKLLNGMSRKYLSDADTKALLDAVSRLPVTFCCPVTICLDSIEMDEYFPLQWKMVVNPLTMIEIYHVFVVPVNISGDKMRCPPSVFFLHSSSATFENAMKEYSEIIEADVSCKSDYFLIGQFRHKKLEVDSLFKPQKLTGILLCRSSIAKTDKKLQIEQVHDVTELCVFRTYLFARYKVRTSKIEFYNGALRRVYYGDVIEHIDLGYYMFE